MPLLELAVRVEDWTNPDTVIVLDSVPDDGGSTPISFSPYTASWLSQTGSSVSLQGGQTSSFPLSFDTHGLADGLYQAELILQGGFIGVTWLPVTLAVGEATEVPPSPILGIPYPNPTSTSFSVRVVLPCVSETKLVLADLSGRIVQTWSGGTVIPGIPFALDFDVDPSVPRGVFTLRLESSCGSTPARLVVRD